jgi:NADH dehydrogenase FAD-containing subunit
MRKCFVSQEKIGNVGKEDLEKITKLLVKQKTLRDEIDHLIDELTDVDVEEQRLTQKHVTPEDSEKYDCFGLDRRNGDITGVTKKTPEDMASEVTDELMSRLFKGDKEEPKKKEPDKK